MAEAGKERRDETVRLLGLDFGSTTSSAMVASTKIGVSSATGRMEFGNPSEIYRSEPAFTPFVDDDLDLERLEGMIDGWLADSGLSTDGIFAGGAITTGLAAQRGNAAELTALVERKIGEAVVATADDPALESWLAFMGSAAGLSRGLPDRPVLNIDIGGGTTNPALGLDGNVIATGCHFVGARHFEFTPGSLRLTRLSPCARAILNHLRIEREVGDELATSDLDAILGFYVDALEALVVGDRAFFAGGLGELHERLPFSHPEGVTDPVVVFSGGVGELVYAQAVGNPPPDTTQFGDLGGELTRRVLSSEVLSAHIDKYVPENYGRATVYGITLHSTEVSGTSLFLQDPGALPLRNLPVVAHLPADADERAFREALTLASSSAHGACLQVSNEGASRLSLEEVRRLGKTLAAAFAATPQPEELPIVLLLTENAGKAVGSYAADWGRSSFNLIVIDEIPVRGADFVNIGRDHHGIVPVSFYGIR